MGIRAVRPEDRESLEKWWPYILRVHWTARTLKRLESESFDAAIECIDAGRRELEALAPQENEVFQAEMRRSVEAFDELEKTIRENRPLSELEQLERDKDEAIRVEDYEKAARLRDRITEVRSAQNAGE